MFHNKKIFPTKIVLYFNELIKQKFKKIFIKRSKKNIFEIPKKNSMYFSLIALRLNEFYQVGRQLFFIY